QTNIAPELRQQFEAHWKEIVISQATAIAGGGEADGAKLARLRLAEDVVEFLRPIRIELPGDATAWNRMQAWADWSMSRELADALLQPMRAEISSLLSDYAAGGRPRLDSARRQLSMYRPILRVIERSIEVSGSLEPPQALLHVACAQLATPMNNAPFAAQRQLCLSVEMWQQTSPEEGLRSLQQTVARIAPSVGLRYRAPR